MLKKDLILRNPLRLLGQTSEDILAGGEFGAVLARAGVGKTALLVQLALNSMLQNKNVLHISLADPIKKVGLWYEEVLRNVARQFNIKQIDQLWQAILPHRLIMTFNVEGFSVPILEERLTDLTEQGIFLPQMILIDGLPFDDFAQKSLVELKSFAKANSTPIWFAVRTHRHEKTDAEGMAAALLHVADLFNLVIQLQPEGEVVHVKILKGQSAGVQQPSLFLDPSTMLIIDKP